MAVFIERGINGSDFNPPDATGNIFLDVGASDFAASFIEQLFLDGITAGCGDNRYCPSAHVTRGQMAVFLLRAKYGAGYTLATVVGVLIEVPLMLMLVKFCLRTRSAFNSDALSRPRLRLSLILAVISGGT